MIVKFFFPCIAFSFFCELDAAAAKEVVSKKRKTVDQAVLKLFCSEKHLKLSADKPLLKEEDHIIDLVVKLSLFIPAEEEQLFDRYKEPLAPRSKQISYQGIWEKN